MSLFERLFGGKKEAKDLSYTLGAVAMAFSGVDPEAGFLSNIGNVQT